MTEYLRILIERGTERNGRRTPERIVEDSRTADADHGIDMGDLLAAVLMAWRPARPAAMLAGVLCELEEWRCLEELAGELGAAHEEFLDAAGKLVEVWEEHDTNLRKSAGVDR